MKYDAFISYSHVADGHFVPMLRNGLQRFATPWGPFRWANPIRSLRIFQDLASLSANPALWPTIEQALTESEWFVLLASPESARSPWVDKEVDLWCRSKPLNRLLMVQTGGVIAWDHAVKDFDWLKTDALPSRLRGTFGEEPRWVDARFAHANADRTTQADPRFRDLVAELAAPLRGVPKDDLIGEDIRQHRRLSLWRNAALVVLTTLLVAALAAAAVAIQQRNLAEQSRIETERQLHISEYRRLAAQAMSADGFDLALLLAIEATRLDDNRETRRTLLDVLHNQRQVRTFFFDRPQSGRLSPVRHVSASADGQLLATDGEDGVTLWDATTHRMLARLGEGSTTALRFVAGGKRLATVAGKTASLWDTKTHQLAAPASRIEMPDPYVAALSSDGGTLAVAGFDDAVIRLSHMATGAQTSVALTGHTKWVTSLAFAPNDRLLASGSADRTIRLWDLAGKAVGAPLVGHSGTVRSVAFTADGRTMASASDAGEIILWDVTTGKPRGQPLTRHAGATYALVFSRDGSMLASGSADHSVLLWDVKTRTPIGDPLVAHRNTIWGLAFVHEDESLVSTGDDGRIVLWSVHAPRIAGTVLAGHTSGIRSLAFSPDGKLLATGSDDGRVLLWDTDSGKRIGLPLAGPPMRSVSLAFASSGNTLATAGDAGSIVLWKVDTQTRIGNPLEGEAAALEMEFRNGDQHLIAVYDNRTSITWDLKTGNRLALASGVTTDEIPNRAEWLKTGTIPAGPLAALNDAASLKHWAVGSSDTTVTVSGDFVFRGHTQAVNVVAFSPDGNTVASGSGDTTAILWDLGLETWRRLACNIANRNLTRDEYETYLARGREDYATLYVARPSCPGWPTEAVNSRR